MREAMWAIVQELRELLKFLRGAAHDLFSLLRELLHLLRHKSTSNVTGGTAHRIQ